MGNKWQAGHPEEARVLRRNHYHANKDQYIRRNAEQRKRAQEWSRALKEGKTCKYCPESFWACLEYHHRPGEVKLFNVGEAIPTRSANKAAILAEIDKCDLVCSNCHRKIHYGSIG